MDRPTHNTVPINSVRTVHILHPTSQAALFFNTINPSEFNCGHTLLKAFGSTVWVITMASTRALLVVAVAVAAVLGTAHGASYTVGAPAGSWDLSTNYTSWASGLRFNAGDQLVFKYSRTAHNVLEVSKADYDSCSNARPRNSFRTGDDLVLLPTGGVTYYFICGVPGHCDGGMKLAVKVEAAAPTAGGAPKAAPAPSPATPGARTPAASGPAAAAPPSSSAAPAAALQFLVGLSVAAVVANLMAFF
jgi:hypothetical protein